MADMNYLEQNVERLLASAEPELSLPGEKKEQILTRLLAQGRVTAGPGLRSLFHRRWTKYAAVAALLIVALIVSLLYLLQSQPQQTVTPEIVHEQPIEQTIEQQDDQALAASRLAKIERLFAQGDVSGLLAMLDSEDMQTRIAAANYLAQIGDISAVGPLEKLSAEWAGQGENPFDAAIEAIRKREGQVEQKTQEQPDASESAVPIEPAEDISALLDSDEPGVIVFVMSEAAGETIADANLSVYMSGGGCETSRRFTLKTNRYGFCKVDFSEGIPSYMSIRAMKGGCVPMMFAWNEDMEIPGEFTFRLDKGTVIGGTVVNEQHEPIADVSVKAYTVEQDSRQKPWVSIRDHIVKTDTDGKWTTDIIPADAEEIYVWLSHPDYADDRTSRSTGRGLIIKQLRDRTAVMVMQQGTKVYGTVVDEQGNPIAAATVMQGEDRYGDDPETTTDEHGRFEFADWYTGWMVLTAKADGFAPHMKEFSVTPERMPIEFVLGPGHIIKGRIVDANGDPVSGARVFSEEWRGYRILDWETLTDSRGRFVWDSAPADEIYLEAGKQRYMMTPSTPVTASQQEYELVLYDPLQVVGHVFDANTGAPIESFEAIYGVAWKEGEDIVWQEQPGTGKQSTNGAFALNINSGGVKYGIKVLAEGYQPGISRDFYIDEGHIELEIGLKRAEPAVTLSGTVYQSDGGPAEGAEVYVLAKDTPGIWLSVEDGKVAYERQLLKNMQSAETDADGMFSFEAPGKLYKLVAVHGSGIAEASQEQFKQDGAVTLSGWGRVEGTIYSGRGPAAGITVHLYDPRTNNDPGGLNFYVACNATTDSEGHFVAERVTPGTMKLVKRIMSESGRVITSSNLGDVEVTEGQTTYVERGGGGRVVTGTLVLGEDIDNFEKWEHSSAQIRGEPPGGRVMIAMYEEVEIPRPERFDEMTLAEVIEWYTAFGQSEEGRVWQREMQEKVREKFGDSVNNSYGLNVTHDGSFTADDVQPGQYRLSATVYAAGRYGSPDYSNPVARTQYSFVVPPVAGGQDDAAIDLGILEVESTSVEKKQAMLVGAVAPNFEVDALEGGKITLRDYAGKYLLVHFWNLLLTPEQDAEFAALRDVYEQYVGQRFDMLGIMVVPRIGFAVELVKKLVDEQGIEWRQAFSDVDGEVQKAYEVEVAGNSWIVLIGPDGRIIAAGLNSEDLLTTVGEALAR